MELVVNGINSSRALGRSTAWRQVGPKIVELTKRSRLFEEVVVHLDGGSRFLLRGWENLCFCMPGLHERGLLKWANRPQVRPSFHCNRNLIGSRFSIQPGNGRNLNSALYASEWRRLALAYTNHASSYAVPKAPDQIVGGLGLSL
jgi:hypothetical protein